MVVVEVLSSSLEDNGDARVNCGTNKDVEKY
jgi:hypothetical protein